MTSHKDAPVMEAEAEGEDINLRLLKAASWFDSAWGLRCAGRGVVLALRRGLQLGLPGGSGCRRPVFWFLIFCFSVF
jgi:hypothetical protein